MHRRSALLQARKDLHYCTEVGDHHVAICDLPDRTLQIEAEVAHLHLELEAEDIAQRLRELQERQ